MPRDYGKRLFDDARNLSPYLGQRMLPGHFSGTSAVLRELLPQDLELEMDQLRRDEAIGAFRPSVVGSLTSAVTVTDSANPNVQTLNVTGTGQ
jgi:hypothetical protein